MLITNTDRRIDIVSLICIAVLSVFGAFNIFGIIPELFKDQIIFLVIGTLGFAIAYRLGYVFIRDNALIFFVIFLGLLLYTVLFGLEVRGAKRWIPLFFFNFQTSEFFKPFFLAYLAMIFSHATSYRLSKIAPIILFISTTIFVIFQQPDLGTAITYIFALSVMWFVSSINRKHFYILSMCSLVMAPLGWLILEGYQRMRIISFINPQIDPSGISYNLNQSIIAVGSGGFWGKGLGLGTQSRYQFLPEYHTDFAFASLVEQFGFVGGAIVIILFAILIIRLMRKAYIKRVERHESLYLFGTASFLIAALIVNVGMNIGVLPVTGIALPFISYGGSSMLATMVMLGFAMST